jgi:hypothetical protein
MKYLLLIISIGLRSELDLTIPEQPAAYIPPKKEFYLHLGDYNEPPTKAQMVTFWTVNALDVYTTYKVLKKCNTCTEQNPLLPDRPQLEELILQKTIVAGLISKNASKNFITSMNITLSLVVINNYEIIK